MYQEGETCVDNSNCDAGLHCEACVADGNVRPRCTRLQPLSPFTKVYCVCVMFPCEFSFDVISSDYR